jgi:hypothetical protein
MTDYELEQKDSFTRTDLLEVASCAADFAVSKFSARFQALLVEALMTLELSREQLDRLSAKAAEIRHELGMGVNDGTRQ